MDMPAQTTFVDLDPQTGQPTPTTYESMGAAVLGRHPVPENLPHEIRGLLLTVVDYLALAYEQANVGRAHLYERLTNDAFLKAVLALELALRHRLGRGAGVKLYKLVSDGIALGLLPGRVEYALIWEELRDNRNAITHGDPNRSCYGPSMGRLIALVVDAVIAMYAAPMLEPSFQGPIKRD